MRSIAPLSCLALVLSVAAPALATQHHAGWSETLPAGDRPARVRTAVEVRRAALGLEGVELGAARAVGDHVVRFTQTWGGVPVVGGGVAVRVDGQSVRSVAVDVAKDLTVDPVPSLDRDAAEDALAAALERTLPRAEQAELVVVRTDGGLLVWQLDVRDSLGGTRYWVDAHTGALVLAQPRAREALGRVYTMNSVETPTPADVDLALLDAADPQHLNGWGGLLAVTNAVSGDSQNGFTVEQTLVPNSGADFLYDPPADPLDATDGFAQVNLYHHLTTMRVFYEGLGVDQTGPSWKVTAVANAKDGNMALDNAFFSPQGQTGTFAAPNLIAIGQGSQNDFAYDSDVFKHEFGHYVSDNAIGYNLGQANFDNLGLNPFSGSIDEGIADYFACSQNDDAELGEASLGPLGAIRNLTDTSKKCPNDLIGEVHADGELIGSLSWSIRETVGAAAADRIVWGALESLMPGANFDDFAQGIKASTQALVDDGTITAADQTAVLGVLTQRGLDDCGRIVTLDPGETGTGVMFGLNLLGQLFGANCAQVQQFGIAVPSLFHYAWKPAATDKGVRISVDFQPLDGAGDIQVTLYARKNQPVTFTNATQFPSVSQFDNQGMITSDTGELILDENSDPPFDPSATYDFVLSSTSCPTLQFHVTAEAYTAPVGTGGAGGGGAGPGAGGAGGAGQGTGGGGSDSDSDDGCGCSVPGTGTGDLGALAGLAALGLVVARRRRR